MKENENAGSLEKIACCFGRLLWFCMFLSAIAFVVLAIYGLCATAVALDRAEPWAEWVAGILFFVAFVLIFREINK